MSNGPGPRPDPELHRAQEDRLRKAWEPPGGWRYFSEVNNNSVGTWYTLTTLLFFLFGGALAILMRAQLAVPDNDLVPARMYDQLFTMHGTVMMFLFAVPIFEAFAIMILPQMTGARDLPFPRLSAYGFWSFAIGGTFVCGSLFFGIAPSDGWFMYPPLTTQYQPGLGADIWLLGLSFIEVAAIAAAVELIVGALRCRAPGMRINLIPLYVWYMLVVAGMILFAFPPLIIGDLFFELERALGWPFFDARRGGDPLLWQHLFWIFGHPEVYIIFLPAVALVAMIVPTFARRPMVGYAWIVLAAVGTGFLSFGLWVHHMFTTGIPPVSLAFFSGASLAVAIPTGVQIFCFIGTILAGRFVRSVPMLFVAGALAIFVIGGLSGVMVAVAPFDFQAHDTYFLVAHLHYVLIGGMVFPVIAGTYYYLPIFAGKRLSERHGKIVFWLMFAGFNIAFLPMHLTGLAGMPRRVYTYGKGLGFDTLNLVSTIGAAILALGVLLFVFDLTRSLIREQKVPRNPWGSGTLDWLPSLPIRPWGLRCVPIIKSRYPLWDQPALMEEVDQGRYYLPDAEEGKRETLITSSIDARPLQCLRVAPPSYLPLLAAATTGGVFIFATFKWWALSLLSGAAALASILVWLWTGTSRIPEKTHKNVGLGLELPLYVSGPGATGWWGMFITMVADASAFASLVFAYFYYWTVNDRFADPADGPGLLWPSVTAVLLLGAWLVTLMARGRNEKGHVRGLRGLLVLGALLCTGGIAAALAGPLLHGMDPAKHVYPATVWAITIWLILHAAIGLIMQIYCLARSFAGRLTPVYDADIRNVALYWHFLAVTALVTFLVIALFPLTL